MQRLLARLLPVVIAYLTGILAVVGSINALLQSIRNGRLEWAYLVVTGLSLLVSIFWESYLSRRAFAEQLQKRMCEELRAFAMTRPDDQLIVWVVNRWWRRWLLRVKRLSFGKIPKPDPTKFVSLTPYLTSHGIREKTDDKHIPLDRGIVGAAYVAGIPIVDHFNGPGELERRSTAIYALAKDQKQDRTVRSMLAVPVIRANTDVVGVIYVRSDEEGAFGRGRSIASAVSTPDSSATRATPALESFITHLELLGQHIIDHYY